jgi:hypothetical protein
MSGEEYSSSNQDQMNQDKKPGILDSIGNFFKSKPKDKTVEELRAEQTSCRDIDSRLQQAEDKERGASNNMSQQGNSNMQQGSGRKSRKQQGGRRRRTRMSGRKRSGKRRRGRKTRR